MQYVFETTVIADGFEEAKKTALDRLRKAGFPSNLAFWADQAKVNASPVLLIDGSVYATSFDFTFRAND